MTRRACKGTNKQGAPCGAAPLKGRDVCIAHADEETRDSTGFGGSQPNSGRKPMPKPDELGRQLIAENAAVLMRPHFRVLGYDVVVDGERPQLVPLNGGARLYGTRQRTGEIVMSEHEDLGAMVTAAERLWDRFYGKPRQTTEVSGPEGGPVQVEGGIDLSRLSADEKRALLELLEKGAPEEG